MSDEELIEKAAAVLWNHIAGEGAVGTDTFAACKRTAQLMLTVFREHTAPAESAVTDEMVERALRASREFPMKRGLDNARNVMRAALEAALEERGKP